MIHIKTEKGKGYEFAEKSHDKYHGVTKFNVKTGIQEKSNSNIPSYTKVFANTLIKHAENDSKIIGINSCNCHLEQVWIYFSKSFLIECLMWELQNSMQ